MKRKTGQNSDENDCSCFSKENSVFYVGQYCPLFIASFGIPFMKYIIG